MEGTRDEGRPTLTIAEIAKRLRLPESTVRYYRDHFAPYVPVVGEGRQRRYPAEALEVFRVIADGMRKNHGSATEVEETLSRMFPRHVESTAIEQQATTEPQQSLPQLAQTPAIRRERITRHPKSPPIPTVIPSNVSRR